MTDILEFRGPNRWLSNFHTAPLHVDGKIYPTNEHYYQAFRARDIHSHEWVRNAKTPAEAMHSGRELKNYGKEKLEWYLIRVQVMFHATLLKYTQHADLRTKLLNTTGNLVEGNSWNDTFWGQCPIGNGQNQLGRVLMEVRTLLRDNNYYDIIEKDEINI